MALIEAVHSRAFHRADVNENIRSTGIRLDETKTLLRVELLYDTGLHDFSFPEAQGFCPAAQTLPHADRSSGEEVTHHRRKKAGKLVRSAETRCRAYKVLDQKNYRPLWIEVG